MWDALRPISHQFPIPDTGRSFLSCDVRCFFCMCRAFILPLRVSVLRSLKRPEMEFEFASSMAYA